MHWFDYLSAPKDWLGGVVPIDLQIGTGENAAMFITHLTAYPIGFEFHFTALTRDDPGAVCQEALRAASGHSMDPKEIHIHIGIEFSDGRRASDLTTWISVHGGLLEPPSLPTDLPPDPESALFLRAGGYEANHREFSGSSWVWPLPPAGTLAFQCGWPAAGVHVQDTTIDAQILHEAAKLAKPLWESKGA